MLRASDICPNEERSFDEADGETCAINHDQDTPAPSPSKNFGIIPRVVMQAGLTPLQFAVYAYLATCASSDGTTTAPKLNTIAKIVESSKGRVQQTINQLVSRGLVSKRAKGTGRQPTKLVFKLLHHKKRPFGRLLREHVTNKQLRPALPLLAMLSMHAGQRDFAWPTRKAQVELLGRTARSLASHQAILVEYGLIAIKKKLDGSNLYTISHHQTEELTTGEANEYSRKVRKGEATEYSGPEISEHLKGEVSEYSYIEPNQSPPKHISNHVAAPPLHGARQRDGTADLSDLEFAVEVIYRFLEYLTEYEKISPPFDRSKTPLSGKARKQLRETVSDQRFGLQAVIDAVRAFNLEMFYNVPKMTRQPNIYMLSAPQFISDWHERSDGLFNRFGITSERQMPHWEEDLKARVRKSHSHMPPPRNLKKNTYHPPQLPSQIAKPRAFEPTTDAERAKDDLYDLCRACPRLDLGLGPLRNSVLMPLLEKRMAEYGLESWRAVLQSIKENPYLRGDQIPERSEDRLRTTALSLASDEYDHFPRILSNDLGSASWPTAEASAILPSDEQQNEIPP